MIEPRKLDNARWASSLENQPDDALSDWVGDLREAAALAALGGLGI